MWTPIQVSHHSFAKVFSHGLETPMERNPQSTIYHIPYAMLSTINYNLVGSPPYQEYYIHPSSNYNKHTTALCPHDEQDLPGDAKQYSNYGIPSLSYGNSGAIHYITQSFNKTMDKINSTSP